MLNTDDVRPEFTMAELRQIAGWAAALGWETFIASCDIGGEESITVKPWFHKDTLWQIDPKPRGYITVRVLDLEISGNFESMGDALDAIRPLTRSEQDLADSHEPRWDMSVADRA